MAQPEARCAGAPSASPPANTARRMATSQTRRPAPLRRQQQRQPPRFRRPGPRLHQGRRSRPRGPGHEATPEDRPPRAVGCARPSLASSLGRGKPPRQLTALGRPPRAPDSPAFHFVPLRSATGRPRARAPPPRRRSQPQAAALPPARAAMPPYRSTALHCVKTAETGEFPRPAHHRA